MLLLALAQSEMFWTVGGRVAPEVARAFNQRAGGWWSELLRAAKLRADRATGVKGRLAARVWEKQTEVGASARVIAVESPAQVAWAEAYLTALAESAPRHGFGFVDGGRGSQVVARSAGGGVPLELLRRRAGQEDGDHRERAGR